MKEEEGFCRRCGWLLLEKPVLVLLFVYRCVGRGECVFGSNIFRCVDVNYSHVLGLLHRFECLGLLVLERRGRTNFITLTDRGVELCKVLSHIKELLG